MGNKKRVFNGGSTMNAFRRRSTSLCQYSFSNFVKPVIFTCALFLLTIKFSSFFREQKNRASGGHHLAIVSLSSVQQCSTEAFLKTGLPFLSNASALPISEFLQRRDRLARALLAENVDAFIVEPGFTFQYYANVSQRDWEEWEPEERPFLMVIKPEVVNVDDEENGGEVVRARTVFLAPKFEVERVRLLGMPFLKEGDGDGKFVIVPWEEHWNPYSTLFDFWNGSNGSVATGRQWEGRSRPKVMVDEEMRDFIQRGLGENGFEVVGLGGEVENVRQMKTQKEIDILRAVNTGTVEAIRAVRGCMVAGLMEKEVKLILDETLRMGGLDPFFNVVLFDEDASNPHGGTDGSKKLEAETFVLIDVGAHLYGYSSDITRTFFPPFLPEARTTSQEESSPPSIQDKINIWNLVHTAQSASIAGMKANATAASIDVAARSIISSAGFADEFTHRVGHGIGIKAHESPYLNKGNTGQILRPGMCFTIEPGVYLEGRFGVRIEDVLLVTEEEVEVLSGKRAKGPWDP